MSASEHAKELTALVKKLKGEYGATAPPLPPAPACPPLDPEEPLLAEFLCSFLLWEATTSKAAAAMKRVQEGVVDFNELRICLPDELGRMFGERYPRVEERALRLRAALNDLYRREHRVTLEPVAKMGKREAKEYLDSLEGVPRFVTSRIFLLSLGGHAAPVDGRIAKRLIEAGVSEPGSTPDTVAASLERMVRAGDLADVYRLLQAWADDAPLNFSETPIELPRRRERSPAPGNHDTRKRPGASRAAAKDPPRKR